MLTKGSTLNSEAVLVSAEETSYDRLLVKVLHIGRGSKGKVTMGDNKQINRI